MTFNISITHNASVTSTPHDGLYVHVLSTWDLYGMSRVTQNEKQDGGKLVAHVLGIPDPWRIRPRDLKDANGRAKPDYVGIDDNAWHFLMKINLEMQWQRTVSKAEYFEWWNSNPLQKGTMTNWLEGLLAANRCYTNKDNRKFQHILTGRFTGKAVLDNPTTVKRRNLTGVGDCYAFECIDARTDLWQYSPMRPADRCYFEEPLSTGRIIGYGKSGAFIVRDDLHKRFPQFGGKAIVPIWLPQDNQAWIPVGHARILTAAQARYDKVFFEG